MHKPPVKRGWFLSFSPAAAAITMVTSEGMRKRFEFQLVEFREGLIGRLETLSVDLAHSKVDSNALEIQNNALKHELGWK